MAVLIEAISVVIRGEAISENYPGGWMQFQEDAPNDTICADGELVRIGFMDPDSARAYIERIETLGLKYYSPPHNIEVVDQHRGPLRLDERRTSTGDWLEFGSFMGGPASNIKVAWARLIGSKLTEFVTPEGWRAENSASFHFVEPGDPRYEFLREEGALAVYLDHESGMEMWGSVVPDDEK